jgi:hypothetical protein
LQALFKIVFQPFTQCFNFLYEFTFTDSFVPRSKRIGYSEFVGLYSPAIFGLGIGGLIFSDKEKSV